MAEGGAASRAEAIAGYKSLLRSFIERRPSGLRGRLASALGKHKSFVSQIASPAYSVPIPADDLPIIFELCHLSPQERRGFLALYRRAHPERVGRRVAALQRHELRLALPEFRSAATAREVEALIRDFSGRIIRLAQHAEAAAADQGGKDHEEADQPGRRRPGAGA